MPNKLLGSVILVLGFLGSIGLLWHFQVSPLLGIGLMGICILLTVLIGGNCLSKEGDLTTGEVRRAIAISCVSVFFGLLAFGDEIQPKGVLKPVLENFWWIIVTLIGFYFGGRSAEKVAEKRKSKESENNEKE